MTIFMDEAELNLGVLNFTFRSIISKYERSDLLGYSVQSENNSMI